MPDIIQENKIFGGKQSVFAHKSECLGGVEARFAVFVPSKPSGAAVIYLSGLTCSWENVMTKAGAQQYAEKYGLIFMAPDTSPRGDADDKGEKIPDSDAFNLGQGAGFYVNATELPWSRHYRMYDYVRCELPQVAKSVVPSLDLGRLGLMGHSMGGHGALIIGIKHSSEFHSLSAFSPICNAMVSPWGQGALRAYLGDDRAAWEDYDACALIKANGYDRDILIDQGSIDEFLEKELMPQNLINACKEKRVSLKFHMREGYDHSYYFIASFIDSHLKWHADRL